MLQVYAHPAIRTLTPAPEITSDFSRPGEYACMMITCSSLKLNFGLCIFAQHILYSCMRKSHTHAHT